MRELSSTLWSVRFVKFWDRCYRPHNLCEHYRSVVGFAMLSVLSLMAGLGVLFVLSMLGAQFFINVPFGIVLLSAFFWLTGLNIFYDCLDDKHKTDWGSMWYDLTVTRVVNGSCKPKQPNLLIEWVKSIHNKVCVPVRIVDKNDVKWDG